MYTSFDYHDCVWGRDLTISRNISHRVSELLYSVNNNQDKGRSNTGIYLYGVGDGGGGPHRLMIERQQRLKDVDGMPKLVLYFYHSTWQLIKIISVN